MSGWSDKANDFLDLITAGTITKENFRAEIHEVLNTLSGSLEAGQITILYSENVNEANA